MAKLANIVTSTAVAAMALAAALASAGPADAQTRVPYQTQVTLSCGPGVCAALFPIVGANKHLELQRVICHARLASTGAIYSVRLSFPRPNGGPFVFDLAMDSKVFSGGNFYDYVFGQDGPFIVPTGRQLRVDLDNGGGTPNLARCSILGHRIG
jgi:hypothetical protein